MKAILLMLGVLSAAIIFVGCGTSVGRATGVDENGNAADKKKALIHCLAESYGVPPEMISLDSADKEALKDCEEMGIEGVVILSHVGEAIAVAIADAEKLQTVVIAGEMVETAENILPFLVEEALNETMEEALSEADERETIIEECNTLSRAEYELSKMSRENREEAIQTAFQECLREAEIEGVEDEQATPEEYVWVARVNEAQRAATVRGITACIEEAERNGQDSPEAREDCLARASRIAIQVSDERGVERVALRQREQDQDVAPLAEQAEELAEEEAPIDGTAEERIAALEERVAELTELIRELTEALQPN